MDETLLVDSSFDGCSDASTKISQKFVITMVEILENLNDASDNVEQYSVAYITQFMLICVINDKDAKTVLHLELI